MRQVSKVNSYVCETKRAVRKADSHGQGLLRRASDGPYRDLGMLSGARGREKSRQPVLKSVADNANDE